MQLSIKVFQFTIKVVSYHGHAFEISLQCTHALASNDIKPCKRVPHRIADDLNMCLESGGNPHHKPVLWGRVRPNCNVYEAVLSSQKCEIQNNTRVCSAVVVVF